MRLAAHFPPLLDIGANRSHHLLQEPGKPLCAPRYAAFGAGREKLAERRLNIGLTLEIILAEGETE